MKIQYKVNLVSLGILTAVAVAISVAGVLTIERLSFDLNQKLLSTELETVVATLADAHHVLEVSGVATAPSYVRSAQQEMVDQLSSGKNRRFGHLTLLALPDVVVMHETLAAGERFDLPCLKQITSQPEGVVQCEHEGEGQLNFFRSFPQWNWVVILSASTSEMLGMRTAFLQNVLIIIALSLLIGGAILIGLTRGVVRPIQQLATAAMELSRGKFNAPLPDVKTDDEVAKLTHAFGVMSENLATAHHDLQGRLEELQATQQALRKSEEKYRGIFQNAVLGVYQVTLEGRVVETNQAMANILGYKDRADVLEHLTDIRHQLYVNPEDRDEFLRLLHRDGSVVDYEVQFVRKDGSTVWAVLHSRPILDENGEIRLIEGTLSDVDQRKRAERELAELNANLERLVEERTMDIARQAEELAEANQRLMELDEIKSAFVTSVSHELRTPLTSVLGFTKLIQRDFRKFDDLLNEGDPQLAKKGARIAKNLEIIQAEALRLTRMVNDFLDLSRIESGRMQWRNSPVNVESMINRAVAAVRPQVSENTELSLMVDIAENLPPLTVDEDRLMQILLNLLNNAIKFTPQGEIRVQAVKNGRCVRVMVQDTGVGIPEKDLEKVFDKFHQVNQGDTLDDSNRGAGLGLAICRQILEHYKGRIWASSNPGRGSVITFELPA